MGFLCLLLFTLIDVCYGTVLTNLSEGFNSSWQLNSCTDAVADGKFVMGGLDGSLLPGDGDPNHNYLIVLHLHENLDVEDLSGYELKLIDEDVPIVKEASLLTSHNRQAVYMAGGRGLNRGELEPNNGVWVCDVDANKWAHVGTSGSPPRAEGAAFINWWANSHNFFIGGYESNKTVPDIANAMRRYTTTMDRWIPGKLANGDPIPAPFLPVQNGIATWWQDGPLLFFLGGESPNKITGVPGEDMTIVPNSWDYVWVWAEHLHRWYKQSTTGATVPRRSKTCGILVADDDGILYLWVFGGADYESQEALDDVSYLVIPSFKWYKAKNLPWKRMDMTCNRLFYNQVFIFGGRSVWNGSNGAGSAEYPVAIYDLLAQTTTKTLMTTAPRYTPPPTVISDLKSAFYPKSWDDPELKSVMMSLEAPFHNNFTKEYGDHDNSGLSSGAQIGIGVGVGIGGLLVLIVLVLLILRRRRGKKRSEKPDPQSLESSPEDEFRGIDEKERPSIAPRTVHEIDPELIGGMKNPAEVGEGLEVYEVEDTALGSEANPVQVGQSRRTHEKPSNEIMMGSEEQPAEIDGVEVGEVDDTRVIPDETNYNREDRVSLISKDGTDGSIGEVSKEGDNRSVKD